MWFIDQCREFIMALRFLSIFPLPGVARLYHDEDPSSRLILGSAYFPIIGLIFGLLLWLLIVLLAPFTPTMVLAALLVVALVIFTGGLHLDGLMDTCDGFFGGRTRERKLEIMHDSRVGSFGVLSAVCTLLLRYACLASLPLSKLPLALLIVLPMTRWCMVLALYVFPNARSTGLGSLYHRTVRPAHIIVAGILSLAIAVIAGHFIGLIVWIAGTIIALALGTWITQDLGGLTGDNYGAIEEVTDIVGLLLLVFLNTSF
jgi:adenosylcobinamide-GDP ribazoletransferase